MYFFFRVFPLGLQLHFNFFALGEDKHAGCPLVEPVDGEWFQAPVGRRQRAPGQAAVKGPKLPG